MHALSDPSSNATSHRPARATPSTTPLRVALIDPSLFSLPYDANLARGLGGLGHEVTLHGRPLRREDNDAQGIALAPSFYRLAENPRAAVLPRALRLGLKGVEHVLSMAMLRRRLARRPPDVIHFEWLPLPAADRRLLGAFRGLAPLVFTVHDTVPFNGAPSAAGQGDAQSDCYALFDRLIVHTEQGRARLRARGVPAGRIARVPHGLLAAVPHDLPPDPMRGEITFLMFGEIKPYKGVDLLIEAFARLPPALRDQGRLRVVGRARMDIAPLRALAEARGVAARFQVEPRFVPTAEIPALFGPGTIAAFPYREIEASGVLSYAIAQGRPVLASRIGGFAEDLGDGVHGLLVPPGDVDALAGAMARLLREREFALRCAGNVAALARAMPGWDEIARQTTAVYAEAIASWRDLRRAA
jgi:glycosyltransferase involved in cell wall biosynthesis